MEDDATSGGEPDRVAQLKAAGFTRSGCWKLDRNGRAKFVGECLSRSPGVYAYVVDGVISYVGSAQRGLSRRLRHYETATNMRTAFRVRTLIESTLAERPGTSVEVFTIVPGPWEWKGIPIDLVLGIEEGLIRAFRPQWNVRGLGRISGAQNLFAD